MSATKKPGCNLTASELERLKYKMISSKRGKSLDWVKGVCAAFNALSNEIPREGDPTNPIPGMVVECKSRPCRLHVRRVERALRTDTKGGGGWTTTVYVTIEWLENWGSKKRGRSRRRMFWRSTWLRWVKSAKVIKTGCE